MHLKQNKKNKMIPYLLAIVGGYLIGDSVGKEVDKKVDSVIPEMAEGGLYGTYKVTFQDDTVDKLTWTEYTYANSEQQAVSRSAESLMRKYPKYNFGKMRVLEVEEGEKFAEGGLMTKGGYNINTTIAKTKKAIKYFEENGSEEEKKNHIPKLKKYLAELEKEKKMAEGGNINKQEWVAVFQKNNEQRIVECYGNTKGDAIRDAMMSRPYNSITNDWELVDIYTIMAEGGEVEEGNKEMLKNLAHQIQHHSKELNNVIKNKDVEAWVVSKAERAATDLSDITHYLDGQ